ncbi:ABC transporter substrate-binding protein [Streptomyces himalayensis]|uniref:ABC transporter substrate-binding protein n=1 Tax=Streptomyces himalayensis subsp. himalayensis TaxID=2756131 RepID=A0A7W0I7W2_9ACTN|nr:ABC transporter substrate-binding protein [Streptomyces himalayensis]MBA2945588.1 ABC transporter substrate-binding protein [Streptomyces himalayensis subsp. himalayensis]
MRRSTALRLAATAVLAGLAATACGTGSADDPANAGQTNQAAEPVDVDTGATVDVRLVLEPTSLDIATTAGAALDQILLDNIYQGLLTRDENNKVKPSLATSYDESSDGLTYTFRLAENATFHDGAKVTAADAVWSLKQVTAKGSKNPDAAALASVKSVSATDDHTVVVKLKHRDTGLTWGLTGRAGIVFKKGTDFSTLVGKENGTGPFKLSGWKRGSSITFVRNDAYWGEKAKVAKVVFQYIKDDNAANNAQQTGQTDIETAVDATLLQPFSDRRKYTVLRGDTTDKFTLALNNAAGPTKDLRVRRAIRQAIDKPGLIKTLGGAAVQVGGPVPATDPGYEGLTSIDAYDPENAKELLRQAGYGDGLKLTVKIPNIYPAEIGDYLASQLKQVGIELTVRQVEFQTWLDAVYTKHDYQLSLVDHAEARDLSNFANPDYYFGYDNANVQKWYAAAQTASGDSERDALLKKAARQVSEDAAADWLFVNQTLTVVRSGVTGVPRNFTSNRYDLANLAVAKK